MTNSTIAEFNYSQMWRHYFDRVGKPSDDVFVRTLTMNYKAEKYNQKTGKTEYFLNRGMDAYVLDDSDPLICAHKETVFKNGGFVVVEKIYEKQDRERIMKKKNLYIVAPQLHKSGLCSADHFSFMLNKGCGSRHLHLHYTKYFPMFDDDSNFGGVRHSPNHLPVEFSILKFLLLIFLTILKFWRSFLYSQFVFSC